MELNNINEPSEEIIEEKKRPGYLRASGKWTDIFIIAATLSVLLMLLGDFLSTEIFHYALPIPALIDRITHDEAVTAFLMQYFDFIGIWIAFILVIIVFKRNRPMWKAFAYNGHGNNLKAVFAGILLGGGMNGFCIFMSWLNGDIVLSFNEFDPVLFLAFLIAVTIQSGAEEIIDRCYLYQKLRRRYRWPAVAIIINSLIFMALHMGNPGVTVLGLLEVFEIGVLFALIVYYYDSLWTAIWAHAAWNFSQSIVFGLPNSGIVSVYSVFKLDAASARDGIFYNTSFGVEGSLGSNVIIAIACVIVLILGIVRKRGERMDYWKEMEENPDQTVRFWEWIIWALVIAAVIALAYLFVSGKITGLNIG